MERKKREKKDDDENKNDRMLSRCMLMVVPFEYAKVSFAFVLQHLLTYNECVGLEKRKKNEFILFQNTCGFILLL